MNDKAEKGFLSIDPQLDDLELPSPQIVNYVTLARVGTLVQITSGFMDIRAIAAKIGELKEKGEAAENVAPMPFPVAVSSRIIMDAQTFHELKKRVDIIHASMGKTGHLKDVGFDPAENKGTKELPDAKEGEAS